MSTEKIYTCSEYREEMLLLGLRRRLYADDISDEERECLMERIKDLESSMGMN